MKWLRVSLLPLNGMLVHHRSLPHNLLGFPNNLSVPIIFYSWMERGTVRVKCLAQEHNTMSLARTRTPAVRSRDECTNHEVTTPSTVLPVFKAIIKKFCKFLNFTQYQTVHFNNQTTCTCNIKKKMSLELNYM